MDFMKKKFKMAFIVLSLNIFRFAKPNKNINDNAINAILNFFFIKSISNLGVLLSSSLILLKNITSFEDRMKGKQNYSLDSQNTF
jgi:hypothetical protein